MVLFSGTFILLLLRTKRRQQQHILEKARLQHRFQHELLQSRLEVQEQSFKNVSEEIHDNVGQVLTLVKMHLYKIGQKAEGPLQADVSRTNELLSKAINDLRTISHTLNNTFVSKAGLLESLEKELDYIGSAKGVVCRLDVAGEPYPLGGEQELMVFRIVQEALGNALKHGAPAEITIHCHFLPDALKIRIGDDGCGFEPAGIASSGIGLDNMQERARLLQGSLQIRSAPGKGTDVELSIKTNYEPELSYPRSPGR